VSGKGHAGGATPISAEYNTILLKSRAAFDVAGDKGYKQEVARWRGMPQQRTVKGEQ